MNCKISVNPDDQHECGGQCGGERSAVPAERALEQELEWRAQERITIAELVDQAHHLIGEVLGGERGREALEMVSGQLAKASQLLNWPRPFVPASRQGEA